LEQVRIELSNESQIEFFLVASFGPSDFAALSREGQLRIEFRDFSKSLIDLFTGALKRPANCQLRYIEGDDGTGNLLFIQVVRVRAVELLRLQFSPGDASSLRQQAQFRFSAAKMELRRVSQEYATIMERLESNNPGLAREINLVIDGLLGEGDQ
jgi:hypothetical protein